ncbi:hypothetical protein J6590_011677 [Homalodisca vitripennis]|nr:hypothetical protein J6590_011677 [Homalodisca vitripennis]
MLDEPDLCEMAAMELCCRAEVAECAACYRKLAASGAIYMIYETACFKGELCITVMCTPY